MTEGVRRIDFSLLSKEDLWKIADDYQGDQTILNSDLHGEGYLRDLAASMAHQHDTWCTPDQHFEPNRRKKISKAWTVELPIETGEQLDKLLGRELPESPEHDYKLSLKAQLE